MPLALDPTTRAEYDAAQTAEARASVVLAALSGTVAVVVRDGTDAVRGTGTMQAPWATVSGAQLVVGEVASFVVTDGGVPDAGWYMAFEAAGRWLRGSFGLADSEANFRWSLPTFTTGQNGMLGTVAARAQGFASIEAGYGATWGILTFAERDLAASWALAPTEAWATIPTISFVEGTADTRDVSQYLLAEGAVAHQGTLPAGVTFNPTLLRFEYDGVGASAATVGNTLEVTPFAEEITTFSMVSGVTGTMPFCFGHAFAEGDAPDFIDSDLTTFQADVKNRWPDGSAKFAVISGQVDFVAGQERTISLRKASAATSGTPVSLAQLDAVLDYGSVTLELAPYGTVDLKPLVAQTSAGYGSPGLVRTWQSGPQCSEWHFYSPVGSDPHLAVWFHVRMYAGGSIEIETIVENGWSFVASPAAKNYTATLTINGSTRFAWTAGETYPHSLVRSDDTTVIVDSGYSAHFAPGITVELVGATTVTGTVLTSTHVPGVGVTLTLDLGVYVVPTGLTAVRRMYGHNPHARWSRSDWFGPNPQVSPVHDVAYIRSTRMVPNYGWTSPPESTWTAGEVTEYRDRVDTTNPEPFYVGNYRADMSAPGHSETIGWAPVWDALYYASGDARAYRMMVGNARLHGRYRVHYRDETDDMRPVRMNRSTFSVRGFTGSSGLKDVGGAVNYFASVADSKSYYGGQWAPSHAPSPAYGAYLATGKYTFLEELQFTVPASYLVLRTGDLRTTQPFVLAVDPPGGVRAHAWRWRTITQAYTATPDSDVLQREDYGASISAQYQHWYDRSRSPTWVNDLGVLFIQTDAGSTGTSRIQHFMEQFTLTAVGMCAHLAVYPASGDAATLTAILDHVYKLPVGMAGNGLTAWGYRRAGQYDTGVVGFGDGVPPSDRWAASWKEAWDASIDLFGWTTFVDSAAEGQSLEPGHYGITVSDPWRSLHFSLALAVEHGVLGADDAWRRLTTSSTYAYYEGLGNFSKFPTWMVVPR